MLFIRISSAALFLTSVIAAPLNPNGEVSKVSPKSPGYPLIARPQAMKIKPRVEDAYWGMFKRSTEIKPRVEDAYWGMFKRYVSLKPGCVQAANIITCSFTNAEIEAAGVTGAELAQNCDFTSGGIDCTYDLSAI
jgi:hypothetical protein